MRDVDRNEECVIVPGMPSTTERKQAERKRHCDGQKEEGIVGGGE